MASFLNVFILVVCSVPCVYSLVYISNIAIPWGDVLPHRETSAYSYDSACGFQTGFLLSCSEFYMFKQALVLPALLHLGDQVKFSVSGKNVDTLPLHAHCLTLHQFPTER